MDAANRFLNAVRTALYRIELPPVRAAAQIVSAALEAGGVVHTFGTGHSSLLAQELFYRAGGLVAINPILDPRLGFECGAFESTAFERTTEGADELSEKAGFRAGDAGVIISNSGANALPVEMAIRMKAAGLKVIVLTNVAQSRATTSRHGSGKRLFELADVVLDNHAPVGDAAVDVEGLQVRLGPLSTIVGASILHAVIVEAAEMLAAKGKPPAAFASANAGEVTTDALRRRAEAYQERIRYFRSGG